MVLGQGHSLIAASLLGTPHDSPGVTHPGSGQGLTLQEGHHAGAATELTVNAAAAQGLVNLQKPCTGPACFRLEKKRKQKKRKKKKEKTTPFGIISMRSQVLCRAAQGSRGVKLFKPAPIFLLLPLACNA